MFLSEWPDALRLMLTKFCTHVEKISKSRSTYLFIIFIYLTSLIGNINETLSKWRTFQILKNVMSRTAFYFLNKSHQPKAIEKTTQF